MNNYKLRQRKMPTILKLGAIALFGACMCVPCLKYQDRFDKLPIPPILTFDLNMRVADDFNNGVIIRTITYNNVDGTYALSYSVPMSIFEPYEAYFNAYVEFTYTSSGNASMGGNWFTGISVTGVDGIVEEQYVTGGRSAIDADSQSSVPLGWSIYENQGEIGVSVGYYVDSNPAIYQELMDVDLDDFTNYPVLIHQSRTGSFLLNAIALLNGSPQSYQQGVNYGIQYVLQHLSEYNLYSQQDYYAYGLSEYNRGLSAGADTLSLGGFVAEIFKAPVTMFKGIFNWELPLPDGYHLNVLPIMTFLLTIGIALAVVNLILKIR